MPELFVKSTGDASYIQTLMPMLLIDEEDMVSILEFRSHFEYGNIRMFMKNCDMEHILQLEHYLDEMINNAGDIEKFHEADFAYHDTIAKGTMNPFVIKISEILIGILKNHQAVLYDSIGPESGIEYHQDILKAIKSDDAKLAGILMRRHVEYAIQDYLDHINKKEAM